MVVPEDAATSGSMQKGLDVTQKVGAMVPTGLVVDVKADLLTGRATVQRTHLNAWGVMHALHTFTGAPAADSWNRRDWMLTTVWALSVDAVAARLIVMVFGSYIMWFRLRGKRLGGIVAMALGFCGAFIGALRWLV